MIVKYLHLTAKLLEEKEEASTKKPVTKIGTTKPATAANKDESLSNDDNIHEDKALAKPGAAAKKEESSLKFETHKG